MGEEKQDPYDVGLTSDTEEDYQPKQNSNCFFYRQTCCKLIVLATYATSTLAVVEVVDTLTKKHLSLVFQYHGSLLACKSP